MKAVLVALGGNALLKKGQKESILTQFKNVEKTIEKISVLAKEHVLTITHGNGPQVGSSLIRVEEAFGKAYSLPLEVVVAETEAEIGYIIQQSLYNFLKRHKIDLPVISVLTQVIVSKEDPAFKNPTKFIGPYYNAKQAVELKKQGMHIKADPRGGFRRVVASPLPLKIVEASAIKKFTKEAIVIAAGGGGIPVVEERGNLRGVEAVIDKDLASAVLATDLGVELFIILTDVPCAYLDFGKPTQRPLRRITLKQAEQYIKEGHFGEGSMGPKIQAAINYLQKVNGLVIITSPEKISQALQQRDGTIISRGFTAR
ncbi:MAG TPA: carbamate kinase [Nanoarchaeota archaeon]|nr:MAG: carbamate kinase [archaeon GW2011_AR6]HIH18012.1 carbamate kinase [Nanoarchaeota archaeon]HIH34341.1 carbamate kinase [Nanoarchaeota archaeon]HIH51447.1 carbamate kinase [Nanoarchaeota archaeon]HIH65724.1 carbamate kinase [Nanoarchaeota archaeon]